MTEQGPEAEAPGPERLRASRAQDIRSGESPYHSITSFFVALNALVASL